MTRAGTLDYMAPEVVVCPSKRFPHENKDNPNLAYDKQVLLPPPLPFHACLPHRKRLPLWQLYRVALCCPCH